MKRFRRYLMIELGWQRSKQITGKMFCKSDFEESYFEQFFFWRISGLSISIAEVVDAIIIWKLLFLWSPYFTPKNCQSSTTSEVGKFVRITFLSSTKFINVLHLAASFVIIQIRAPTNNTLHFFWPILDPLPPTSNPPGAHLWCDIFSFYKKT